MSDIITKTYITSQDADPILLRLHENGVPTENISLVMTDDTGGESFAIESSSKVEEGLAVGATTGGLAGGILGLLATGTAMAIPGLNIIVAGGIITGLAGLGAGAATGGLIGALVGSGIPEHEAKLIEDDVKAGNLLLAVKIPEGHDRQSIERLL